MTTAHLHAGFGMIELMVTVALAAIVVTLAAPGFTNMIQANRVATQANSFLSSLIYARSEAIKRGERVTVCKSANLQSCSTSSSVTWDEGWIVELFPTISQ